MSYFKKAIDFFLKEKIEQIHSVEEVNLPDGIYDAIMGGYQVDVKEYNISFKTNVGIKCRNCPRKIEVINKKAVII